MAQCVVCEKNSRYGIIDFNKFDSNQRIGEEKRMKKIIEKVNLYIEKHKVTLLVASDIVLMILSMSLSGILVDRGFSALSFLFVKFWWIIPLNLVLRIGAFHAFGIYYWTLKYISIREAFSFIKAIVLSSMFLIVVLVAVGGKDFPFSILVVEVLISFAFIGGLRFLIRAFRETEFQQEVSVQKKNILIVGAGDAGEMILREMLKLSKLGYRPIGFVDDNPLYRGKFIHQLPILGSCEEIPEIVKAKEAEEIIIAIPSANYKQVKRIVSYCEKSDAKFRIVPGIFELIDGTVHVNQITNVEIEDLLGREAVKLDINNISSYLSNSCVLITGAGGSIGSELCRQIAMYNPSKMVIFGKGEYSIYEIEYELRNKFPYLSLAVYIANTRDIDRINNIFKREKPNVVFHTAAYKHVSLMEKNPDEAILNNVIGTKNMIEVAERHNVREFVITSTDKAVNPSSIMGATKRIAEMIIQSKSLSRSNSKTKFICVRFGNVLGSRGSVVPLFKRQIAVGGPVTVTHPETKRYFMTIPEAVQLIMQAGAMGKGGEIFILDMGEPVKIVDLAKDLIRLSGLDLGIDIDINFVGLKPGEKLFEEILTAEEGTIATKHEKIFVATPLKIAIDKLDNDVKALEIYALKGEDENIRSKIKEMLPEFREEGIIS